MEPCRTLFIPTGTSNGPPLADLEKCRVTDVQFCDGGGKETTHEQWLAHDGQNRVLNKRWT
eukprot:10253060-Karenia_brevis.AAC.1